MPKKLDIDARYEQKTYDKNKMFNRFHPIVSSLAVDKESVWINQDAILSLAQLDSNKTSDYYTTFAPSVVYFFVISGKVTIQGEILQSRDAMYLNQTEQNIVTAEKTSQILSNETIQ